MEVWETIKNYPDYQISNYGRVKSLKHGKVKMLKGGIDINGYKLISLYNPKQKTFKVHKLVAIHFLNHIPCGWELVINHKDFNKLNNHIDNLEIITSRENTNKKHLKSSSQYVGVSWHKLTEKWSAYISIKGKINHLGIFEKEIDAHNAYQNKLKELDL